MGIYYGDFLWGNLMGIFNCTLQAHASPCQPWPAQHGPAPPSQACPAQDPFHLPLMGIFNRTLYNKFIVQSTIKNPHKNQTMVFNISYHNFYGLGI